MVYKSTIDVIRLATEEEKQKLFDAIKSNGYKWNPDTKTLEKSVEPKFKVGDIIQDEDGYKVKITEVNIEDECYGYESTIAKGVGSISFSNQNNWELVPNHKFNVGDRITFKYYDRKIAKIIEISNDGYKLDNGKTIQFQDENAYEMSNDKFDITTLKPFDKVLVRGGNQHSWKAGCFSHIENDDKLYYIVNASYWRQCIPYEGNEHLVGTKDDCDEFYKNW